MGAVQLFIERWADSGAAERANCQIFLSELCALLDVPPPEPATPDINLNAYVFERDGSSTTGRIDLYKRGTVAQAYGWPADLSDEEILERLVALNAARAAEEAQGRIRYLCPEFQCLESVQGELNVDTTPPSRSAQSASATKRDGGVASTLSKQPWPKSLLDQVQALRAALAAAPSPVTAEELARTFSRARTDRVADLLETLAALGQAQHMEGGRYTSG